MSKRFKLVIFFFSAYVVVTSFYFYVSGAARYNNAEKVEAVVVDHLIGTRRGRGRSSTFKYPQFRFEYKGDVYFFAQRSGAFQVGYPIGREVTVFFPEGEPGKAEAYNFFTVWMPLHKVLLSLFFAVSLFVVFFIVPKFVGWYRDFKKEYKAR